MGVISSSSAAALPERPRLRTGCRIFDDQTGTIVRSCSGAYRIAPERRQAMLRILPKLDGFHDFNTLLSGENIEDAFYALHILDVFARGGLLTDGAATGSPVPEKPLIRLDGSALVVPDHGYISAALANSLDALGALIVRDRLPAENRSFITVICPDGPNLKLLEATNRQLLHRHVAWLPVFPFGDSIVIGPLYQTDVTPCFRCFELRWLGISSSIALELSYFDHLRCGGWKDEALDYVRQSTAIADQAAATVAKYLAGRRSGASVTLLQRETGAVVTSCLERHPYCEICASPTGRNLAIPAEADWFDPSLELAEVRRQVLEVAGGICGLACIVPPPKNQSQRQSADLPEVVVARFAMPEPEQVDGDQDNWAHGSAPTAEDAETLAIIECLERYNGLLQPSSTVSANYISVASEAIPLTELPLFSEAQYARPGFPFQRFDPERETRWCWAYNLTKKRPVLVPATAAWYGQDDELLGETSSGVAAHSSRGHALLNGALEIVERDAFMIHWLHRLSPPLVELSELQNTSACAWVRYIEKSGYSVRLAELTTDLAIPVFLAIAFREDRKRPALIVGAGASLDPVNAAVRALRELCSAAMNDTDSWILRPALPMDGIVRLEDHSRAYEHPEWLPHASFLWASSRRSPLRQTSVPDDPLDQLSQLTTVLESHGHDLVGVDITSPDVAKRCLRVVRAIIPGLQPLGFGHRIRLGGRRLYEAPARMGCSSSAKCEEDLNPVPHCFP